MSCAEVPAGELGAAVPDRSRPASRRWSRRRSARQPVSWWEWVAASAVAFPCGGMAYHLATVREE